MEQGLQKVNHQSRLMEWGQRVEIRAGADAETIQAIIQALKLC